MRRLHVTVVLVGALVLVGSLGVATALFAGGTTENGTSAATADSTRTTVDTDVEPTVARPPTVRVLDEADGASTTNPFREQAWSRTDIFVHVGAGLGGETEPVAVLVLNNGSERSIPVSARHRPSETTLYDRAPTFATAEGLVFVFHEPGDYAIEVRAGEETATVDLRDGDFDCNERTVGVAVEPNGTTVSQRVSTLLGCGAV